MKLYRPVLSDKLTQGFGENLACARLRPGGFPYLPYKVISAQNGVCPVGSKSFYSFMGLKGHNGYDHSSWRGEPVYHCADFSGYMKTEHDKDGGLGVDVISLEKILPCSLGCPEGTFHNVKIRYWHGLRAVGFDGKVVKPGDEIMRADSTGSSTGNHVHWAPKWCDLSGKGLHTDNGYQGAIDPTPFYTNNFIGYLNQKPTLTLGEGLNKLAFGIGNFFG